MDTTQINNDGGKSHAIRDNPRHAADEWTAAVRGTPLYCYTVTPSTPFGALLPIWCYLLCGVQVTTLPPDSPPLTLFAAIALGLCMVISMHRLTLHPQ